MPLFRRLPKRGFNPLRKDRVAKINLYKIQEIIDKKILTSNILNLETLKKSKLVANSFNKIKILGSGDLKDRIEINVDYVSKSAKIKLEKNGSKINLKKKV